MFDFMIKYMNTSKDKTMPEFHIKNQKGLFGTAYPKFIISEHGHKHLVAQALKPSEDTKKLFSEKERTDILATLENIAKFPKEKDSLYAKKNDSANLKFKALSRPVQQYGDQGYGYKSMMAHQIHLVSTFSSSSQIYSYGKEVSQAVFLQNLALAKSLEKLPLLERFAHHLDVSFDKKPVLTAVKVLKKIETGEIEVSQKNEALEFGKAVSYLVFLSGTGGGGYLNQKGGTGTLAAARMFESRGAAERTITAQQIKKSALVVEVNVALSKVLEKSSEFKGDASRLETSLCLVEKEMLLKALDGATVEQLKERLAKYEDVSLLDQKNKPKKRAL